MKKRADHNADQKLTHKREVIESKQKRWMEDRQNTLSAVSVSSVSKSTSISTVGTNVAESYSKQSHGTASDGPEDRLLNKLTEKLTGQIRDEIKREMKSSLHNTEIRDAVADKMESYLQAELHTHTCKICSELMTSPDYTPMILFPCGHSFCKLCVSLQRKKSNTCPYCREKIESAAVNQSLRDLIEQFASQKAKVTGGLAQGLEDVFPSPDPVQAAAAVAAARERTKYKGQMKSCMMRHAILVSELNEIDDEKAAVLKRKQSADLACLHLESEAADVQRRLQALLDEKELIDIHLKERRDKRDELDALTRETERRADVIMSSLEALETEIEKLGLLSEGVES